MEKVVSHSYYWRCIDSDYCSPIEESGLVLLFDNGTTEYIENGNEEDIIYERCDEEEVKNYLRTYRNAVFEGDKVTISKGKKMVGETKIVKYSFRYEVKNTYGHKLVDYLVFEDGTKVNLINCLNSLGKEVRQFVKNVRKYDFPIGGQIY